MLTVRQVAHQLAVMATIIAVYMEHQTITVILRRMILQQVEQLLL
jgi:hypothetical protein